MNSTEENSNQFLETISIFRYFKNVFEHTVKTFYHWLIVDNNHCEGTRKRRSIYFKIQVGIESLQSDKKLFENLKKCFPINSASGCIDGILIKNHWIFIS